ncbi:MAG: hypothetical protein GXO75_05920 [Calditrichaeota bacterium]|nr:hypothetical protein [Calditrichota bacterium]
MKHKEIQKKLLRYIEAELPPDERAEVQLHLERCEQCRKDVQSLSGAWNLSQSIKQVQPSPFLWNKISAQLGGKTQKGGLVNKVRVFIRQTARPALTAAIVMLGLFIGIKLGNRLMMTEVSSRQAGTSLQLQSEFGLENFRVLSSGSLGGELAAFMDYENE